MNKLAEIVAFLNHILLHASVLLYPDSFTFALLKDTLSTHYTLFLWSDLANLDQDPKPQQSQGNTQPYYSSLCTATLIYYLFNPVVDQDLTIQISHAKIFITVR